MHIWPNLVEEKAGTGDCSIDAWDHGQGVFRPEIVVLRECDQNTEVENGCSWINCVVFAIVRHER